jgi:hypothetical protein
MNQIVPIRTNGAEIMESVLIKGDLSKLSPQERSNYYMKVCESVGLNPLTKPFEYITLNGKLTLYALRTCTDQLRGIHKVSVVDLAETEREGIIIVTAKVQNGDGRTDMAKGAVTIGNLKGDALCNAIMKAETKAKRRATLSLCGLGFLDETEIETIPAVAKTETRENPHVTRPADLSDAKPRHDENGNRIDWIDTSEHRVERLSKAKARPVAATLNTAMRMCADPSELVEWGLEHAEQVASLPADWEEIFQNRYQEFLDELRTPHNANILKAG